MIACECYRKECDFELDFLQVVLRERARFSGRGLAQLAAVILGFTTMCLVEMYIGEEITSSCTSLINNKNSPENFCL